MFDSDLNEDGARQKVTRRAFVLSGGMAAAAIAAWSLHSAPPPLSTALPSGPAPEVEIAEFFCGRLAHRDRSGCRKSLRATRSGGGNFPPTPSTLPAGPIPRWLIRVPTGIYTSEESIAASAAIRRFSLPRPSSIQARAGRVSGSRSPGKTLWRRKTGAGVSGRLSHALDVTRIRGTSLMMGRRQRVYATASIRHPWCSSPSSSFTYSSF